MNCRHLDPTKKANHNQMEKKRRDEMKGDFDGLKLVLPGFAASELVPKITILTTANDHITDLIDRSRELDGRLQLARKDHDVLMQRLTLLEKKA